METYFASPERATPGEIYRDIYDASNNPVIDGLLNTVSGLLAVLNEHRQILAVNDSFLKVIGIDDSAKILGLRPGEAIKCIHAHEMPGGCGTSEYCSTCGAAIAIVTAISSNKPVERKCVATVSKDGADQDICLQVRACPIIINSRRFILLFIQDITMQERWASVERAFFHDINNIIMGLQGASELMEFADQEDILRLSKQMQHMSQHLTKEVALQKTLSGSRSGSYEVSSSKFSTDAVINEMKIVFAGHPTSRNKYLEIPDAMPVMMLNTDIHLVSRIIMNMLVNAFEATDEGGTVKLWITRENSNTSFHVWNRQAIPENVSKRVFQKFFSTKGNEGRGMGTYAMKLFGENFLGGKVDFTTYVADGTTFSFSLTSRDNA